MGCDIGEATERLEKELCCISQYLWAPLILQPFRHFTYVTAHSLTLPSLYLRHSSFSNPSFASSTSQLILQPFFRFSYVTWRAAHDILCIWSVIWTWDLQFYALAFYPLDHWDTHPNSETNSSLIHITIQESCEGNTVLQFYFESNPTSEYFVWVYFIY